MNYNLLTNNIADINGDTPVVMVTGDKFDAALSERSVTVVVRNKEAVPVFQTPFHRLDREGIYIGTEDGSVATARVTGMAILGEQAQSRHNLPNRPWAFTLTDVQPIPRAVAEVVRPRRRFLVTDLSL